MKFDTRSDLGAVLRALDKAGGTKLTAALRAGYTAAAREVRDKARVTTAFKSRTGTAKLRSWKVSSRARPFNHAKLSNTAFYSMFLEGKPLESGFLERAARSTNREQMNAVAKAVRRHLAKLRGLPK